MGPNGLRAETRRLSLLRIRRENPLFQGNASESLFLLPQYNSIMDFRSGFKGRISFVLIFVGNGKSGRAEKRGRLLRGLSPPSRAGSGTVPPSRIPREVRDCGTVPEPAVPFRRGAQRDTRNNRPRTKTAPGRSRGLNLN